jgi:hypothetical protein
MKREEGLTTYQVDPALEYRTFAQNSGRGDEYSRPSIRADGRVLAVSTDRGVVFWDLARGAELGLLPIGRVAASRFDPSGDLLTTGSIGVQRWPLVLDPDRGKFCAGPPQTLPLPAKLGEIDTDRSGRIVALSGGTFAFVATPEGTKLVGPLDFCSYVAVSPDGEWLATGDHLKNGVQVWRLHDATEAAHLAVDGSVDVAFSPDGKWLMTVPAPCLLWAVGTWREPMRIGGRGLCFSPDGRLVVVQDDTGVLRLVDIKSGRALARLESPDRCQVRAASFSADGSRLVITTPDGPAIHVWDLRAIRHRLAEMGLDWEAPPFSHDDPASPALPPLPPLKFDYGPHLRTAYLDPGISEPFIAELERALVRYPNHPGLRYTLAGHCDNYASELANASGSARDPGRAVRLASRAVELWPGQSFFLHTLGVAHYRAGHLTEAIATLEKSLAASDGRLEPFVFFFLAMVRFQLGQITQAHADFDRASSWPRGHPDAPMGWNESLDAFEAEARALLAGRPSIDLPVDVFAPR